MSGIELDAVRTRQTARFDGDGVAAVAAGPINWLHLAAAPTFAIMAFLNCMPGGEADMMCSAAHGMSQFDGMVTMYVLMGAFHCGPWLKLISR